MIDNTELVIRLLFSFFAGGLIGLEREVVHKPAGIRTHMLVCLGCTLFALVALKSVPNEIARVIAGIATGIGFLGAGTIFKSSKEVQGLTTAASIWTIAAVGLSIGLGYYLLTLIAVIMILIILQLNKLDFIRRLER